MPFHRLHEAPDRMQSPGAECKIEIIRLVFDILEIVLKFGFIQHGVEVAQGVAWGAREGLVLDQDQLGCLLAEERLAKGGD